MTEIEAAIAGYLIGSAPISFLFVRAARGIDLRREGSGNVGATNVYRTSGLSLAAVVLAIDIAKGVFSVLIGGNGTGGLVAGIAAVVGHVFPVWLGFKGGKGVATATGVFTVLAPELAGIAALVFLAVVAATRYVSLGSILGALTVTAGAWWLGPRALAIATTAITALIIVAHRGNLVRLWSGRERAI